jgi:hypothetical protein
MFDLIEINLTRIRKMAEQADDDFLLYLIDIAIIEANAKARCRKDNLEAVIPSALEGDDQAFAQQPAADVQIVS